MYVIEKIYEITKGDAIICTEVGQHQMWTAQFYKFSQPRTFITSGGLGTMGYGLPASIGAKVGRPDKTVIDIAGDGSIQMVSQEFATAVFNKIPVKIMILNNGYLGMVRQWQEFFYNKRYSHTSIQNSVDFVKLIEAYGGVGFRVTEKSQVEETIKKALSIDNVVVVDFWIDREENVYPMVPAGSPINQMLEFE
jgi:acetolactate synthase-1/2/3 large subunit